MKSKRSKILGAALGYLIFFVTVAVIISVAIAVYVSAEKKFEGNFGMIFALMLLTVVFLALVCIVIDVVRRKVMVERSVQKILDATGSIAGGDFTVRLETAHPFAQTFHQLGYFLTAEKQQDYQYDEDYLLCSYSKHHF